MKLLLSIWLVILSFIPLTKPLPPEDQVEMNFFNDVENQYQKYMQLSNLSYFSSEFDLIVVCGIYNNEPSYGLLLYSDYDLIVSSINGSFKVPKIYENVSSVIALKADVSYEVSIFTKDGKEYQLPKRIILDKTTKSELETLDLIQGNNNYKPFVSLEVYSYHIPFYKSIIIVITSVLGMTILIMIMMLIFKKGFFNKDKRKEGVLDIRSIVESDPENEPKINFEDIKIFNDEEPNKEIKQIEKTESYFDDEEEKDQIDVTKHLQSLGFITDYNILSEDEKNLIMLELMKLKDQKTISQKTYYEETYKLWKK